MDVIPSSADAGSGRLLKNCPHCRLRVRLSQRERMGEEGYVARLCNCTQGRFLLPGGESEDEGFQHSARDPVEVTFKFTQRTPRPRKHSGLRMTVLWGIHRIHQPKRFLVRQYRLRHLVHHVGETDLVLRIGEGVASARTGMAEGIA